MLRELRIREVAIIDEVVLSFGPGLNVISGETGAGKSILLQSLALLCGARGSADLIRADADEAVVEGLFDCAVPDTLREALGLDDDGEVLVRRHLARSGKGRIYVNGAPVTLALLAQLGEYLVHIYGQHEQAVLLRPANHLELLDRFADLGRERAGMADAFAIYAEARRQRDELSRRAADLAQRRDLLEFQQRELSAAAPRPGEEASLRQDRELLRHAERIEAICREGESLLYSGQGAMVGALTRLQHQLAELSTIAPALGEVAGLVDSGRVQLEEAALQLRAAAERLDRDPARLESIEERLVLLQRLSRKYGVPADALPVALADLERDLATLESVAADGAAAEAIEAQRREEALAVARALSGARRAAARQLEARMAAELAALGMSGAQLGVDQEADDGALTTDGIDRVEFLLAANPGEPPKPLARVASGGELSRIMLALKALAATAGETPILIFDEVDAGIGGSVALAVARRLKALAQSRQLLCITHLAQIAAYADQHVAVEKRQSAGRVITHARALDAGQRVAEVSRMLGGTAAPAEAERYAKRLLAEARRTGAGSEP
ncbi:MAG TPA: DNA repair protein RecN [Candidatus Dormibacteraeota bacterium]|nr:DNA repair protein RecN [Candidatus Dormibacteraeota bacterium]